MAVDGKDAYKMPVRSDHALEMYELKEKMLYNMKAS